MAGPQDPNLTLTRRQIVVYGFSAALGGVSLIGCGGSGHRSGGGSTKPGTVALSGSVVLPSGLSSAGLVFVSGLGESKIGGGKVSARALDGSPTLASVVDVATGRVVTLGMIDPAAGRFTLDSANLAATLLFLALGGSQEGDAERQRLWGVLTSDSATATLATVAASRLTADAFALENGDAALKAAIQTAIDASAGRPRSRTAAPVVKKRGRGRAELVRPTPAVEINLTQGVNVFPTSALGHATASDGVASLPDFVSLQTFAPLETAFYAYHELQSGETVTSVKKLVGPLRVKPSRDRSLVESDPISFGLDDPADAAERIGFVGLTPFFDYPGGATIPSSYLDAFGDWTLELKEMWKRTATLMAADIGFEAAGLGRAFYDSDRLTQATAALGALPGAQPGLGGAAGGRDFAKNVDLLLGYASGSDADAQAFLNAVMPLAPAGDAPSAARLAQARGVLRVSDLTGLYVSAATYGQVFKAVQFDEVSNPGPTAQLLSPGSLSRVIPKLTPERTTYTANGATVGFTLTIDPTSYADATLLYHWKVFGAGTTRLSDGKGKGGTEFDSKEKFVTLAPGSDASGVQTVSVEAFSTLTGTKFSVGKASASISAGGSSHFTLLSDETHPYPGGTGGWSVTYDRNNDPSGWPGIDPSHLKFHWEIDSNALGLLGVSAGTGTVVETTKNAILFFAKAGAIDGDSVGMRVTVSVVDPATGDFTNLAVLTGTARIDVGNHCRFEVTGSSFSLETLKYPDVVRVLEARSGTFSSDSSGPYASATYARPGTTDVDFVGLVFRPLDSYSEGSELTVEVQGATGPTSATTLYPATGFPYFSATAASGNARVLQVVKNASGVVTYLKVTTNVTFIESGSGRSLTAYVICGIGFPS